MNFSRIERRGSKWVVVSGSDEKGCTIWHTTRSKKNAIDYANRLARVSGGEYRGEHLPTEVK
jgi:hypothetical protein